MHFGSRLKPAVSCLALAAALCLSHGAQTNQITIPARPESWARKIDLPGIPNCYEVATNLYRGAQPTVRGMTELKNRGIKTVVDLRAMHSDRSRLAGADLKSEWIPTEPWRGTENDVVQFLRIVTNTNNLPVLFHCKRGADRTGFMCAMYRVTVCGWSKDEAIREMKDGGFGFAPMWQNLVEFVKNADVDRIRRRAGIAPPSKPQPAVDVIASTTADVESADAKETKKDGDLTPSSKSTPDSRPVVRP